MQTIISFIFLISSLFDTSLSIFVFCLVDELRYKPEKTMEFSDTMRTFFPTEMISLLLLTIISLINGSWILFILSLPGTIYNLRFYLTKKHKIYTSIGDEIKDYSSYSLLYKFKFVYYLILVIISMIKFFISLTNLVSYNIFGETNLFFNIIKYIGLY